MINSSEVKIFSGYKKEKESGLSHRLCPREVSRL
jgi:hypothetical protein